VSESPVQFLENHSSKKPETTRVTSRKREARKTVGITLPPSLLEKARKHKLNISRICEQALQSVLEALETQKTYKNEKGGSAETPSGFSQCSGRDLNPRLRLERPLLRIFRQNIL